MRRKTNTDIVDVKTQLKAGGKIMEIILNYLHPRPVYFMVQSSENPSKDTSAGADNK